MKSKFITFVTTHKAILIAFILGILLMNLGNMYIRPKGDYDKMITMIFKHPNLFPLGYETKISAEAHYASYKHMTQENWDRYYSEASSENEAKKAALHKTMDILTMDLRKAADENTVNGGSIAVTLGGPATGLYVAVNAIGKNSMSKEEIKLYHYNIKVLLNSIPDNLPSRRVLTQHRLYKVQYLDTFAKVRFYKDNTSDNLEFIGEKYRGQF